MNPLRDNKGETFRNLSRGERVYLMMKHSFEIQCSPLRKLKHKTLSAPSSQNRVSAPPPVNET